MASRAHPARPPRASLAAPTAVSAGARSSPHRVVASARARTRARLAALVLASVPLACSSSEGGGGGAGGVTATIGGAAGGGGSGGVAGGSGAAPGALGGTAGESLGGSAGLGSAGLGSAGLGGTPSGGGSAGGGGTPSGGAPVDAGPPAPTVLGSCDRTATLDQCHTYPLTLSGEQQQTVESGCTSSGAAWLEGETCPSGASAACTGYETSGIALSSYYYGAPTTTAQQCEASGGVWQSGPPTQPGACRPDGYSCVAFESASDTPESVEAACLAAGQLYIPQACPTAPVIATCVVESTKRTSYYYPTFVGLAAAESACAADGGVWTAS